MEKASNKLQSNRWPVHQFVHMAEVIEVNHSIRIGLRSVHRPGESANDSNRCNLFIMLQQCPGCARAID